MLGKNTHLGVFARASKALCQTVSVSFGWIVDRMKSKPALPALLHFRVAVIFIFGLLLAFSAAAQVPRSSHVVLVIEENTSFNTTVANMPWLVSQGNANGHATNFISYTCGSRMDYLWLMSGTCRSSDHWTFPAAAHE